MKFLPLIIAGMAFSLSSLTANSESTPNESGVLLTHLESSPHYVSLEAKIEVIKQSTVSAQTQGIVEIVNFDVD
jgi:hypothetical protein